MSSKKDFDKRSIYTITNYFYWFFMGNLYFLLLNIPLLLLLIKINYYGIMEASILEIFLCSLPLGPAFTALLGVMGKLLREKDVNITKDYFRMYKMNFRQAIFLWMIQLTILIILYVDINSVKNGIYFLFILLFLLVSVCGFYMFPIVSRFHIKSKEVIIMSIVYIFKKIKTTMLIIMTLLLNFMIFNLIPGISVLFVISLMCYAIMYFQNALLKAIETENYHRKNFL